MSALLGWLDARATARSTVVLLCLLVVVLVCENTLLFPLSVPYMKQTTGQNYLDMCAFCSPSQIYDQLTTFGERGRALQLWLMPTVDIVIPVLSGLFGAVALTFLSRSLRATRPAFRWLALLPLAATALDFTENAGIVLLTSEYPRRLDAIAAFTGFTTGIKTTAYALTALAVLLLAARRLVRSAQPTAGVT